MDGILYTFLGPRVPLEVRKLIALYPNWKEEHIDAVLTLVLKYLHGGPNQPGFTQDDFEIFASTLGLDEDSVAAVFTGLYYILRSAVRSKLKEEMIEKDLSQELKLSPFLVGRILTVLRKRCTRFIYRLHLKSHTILSHTSHDAAKLDSKNNFWNPIQYEVEHLSKPSNGGSMSVSHPTANRGFYSPPS